MTSALRAPTPDDLALFFAHQQDPVAVRMAAFTSEHLDDEAAFQARWRRILADDSIRVRTVLIDQTAVGHVLKYVSEGRPEVSYWFGSEHWGHGYATQALRLFLTELSERPVFARAAQDNVGSLKVLGHNGFVVTGEGSGPAAGRGQVVREYLLTLA